MSPVQSTDLLLINRTGVDYKAPLSQVKDGVLGSHVIQSATPPTLATHPDIVNGTIWVDTSQSPPVINVWDSTANGGAGGWEEMTGGAPKPVNPAPTDFAANPAFVSGTGTQADPFIITPSTVAAPGGTVQSAQQLTLTGQKEGAAINWVDNSVGVGNRFQQAGGAVPAGGTVNLRLSYLDTPNSTAGQNYTGNLQLGTTYFRWVVTQQVAKAPDVGAVTLADVAGGSRFTSVSFPVSATMTENGIPASTKKLKAYVEGTLKSAAQSSAIVSVAATTQPDWNTMVIPADRSHFFFGQGFGADGATATITFVPPLQVKTELLLSQAHWRALGDGIDGPDNGSTKGCIIRYNDINVAYGTKIPGPFTLNKVSYTGGYYVSGGGTAENSAVGIVVDGTRLMPNAVNTVITFTDNTQLADFAGGDAITEVTSTGTAGDATGTVGAVDAVAKTITLATTAGTWDVGSAVKGPLKTQMVTVTPNSDVITNVADTSVYALLDSAKRVGSTTISGGDLVFGGAINNSGVPATVHPSGRNCYWEVTCANTNAQFGLSHASGRYSFINLSNSTIISSSPTSVGFSSGATTYGVAVSSGGVVTYFKDGAQIGSNTIPGFDGTEDAWFTGEGTCNFGPTFRFAPPAGYSALKTGDMVLTFATAKDLAKFAAGDAVRQDSGGPASGTVASVDTTAKTMTLATSTGTWGPANAGHYVIGPTKTGPAANVKLYCKLDAAGAVSDLQSADPGFTAWTPAGTGPYTGNITFPATLPSGAAPDTDLPAGTTITVEVEATNTAGTDSAKSSTITPA